MTTELPEDNLPPEPAAEVIKPAPVFDEVLIDEPEPASELPPAQLVPEEVKAGPAVQNVVFEQPPLEEIATEKWDPEADTIDLPTGSEDEVNEAVEGAANVDLMDSAKARAWANALNEGLKLNTFGKVFAETLLQPGSEFRQAFEHGGRLIGSATPRFDENDNQVLTGERGVLQVLSDLGLASVYQAQLPNSGVWVTFKSPSETELAAFHHSLTEDKIQLGRYSYGLMFSNVTSFTVDRVWQFALDHIYRTTIKSSELSEKALGDIIRIQDLPSFLAGFAQTLYPRGFQYRRACACNPEKCNHVTEGKINIGKLQVVNHKPMTDWMKTHLAVRRANSKSLADVTRYQSELSRAQPWRAQLEGADKLYITFRSPTVNEYIDSGHVWIGNIVEMIDKTLSAKASDNERNALITRHGQATTMRQYGHWVESIEVGTKVIEDRETIEKMLDRLSADNTIRLSFIKKVVEYINSSTLGVIGLPAYTCPVCSEDQEEETPVKGFKDVIPLDVIQLFFVLITQRIQRISLR